MSTEGGTKAVVAALTANLGIGITKFAAWGLTGASSMLAEAIHSVADSGNQVLLLVGGRRARKEATEEHPFGYSRYRYYYAFLVAIVLFSLGGLFALYEAWHKFSHPEPIESWHWVPLLVLVVAIGLETMSFRTAIVESNKVRGKVGWGRFIRRSRSPELPVILLEDFGALVGLVFALFGVSMTLITHDGRWDAIGTLMIGLLLVVIAVVLGRETRGMLLGESAVEEDVAAIRAALAEAGYPDVIHLRTMHLGPDDVLVTAKVAAEADATLDALSARTDTAERLIREAVPAARLIFIETDVRRANDPAPASSPTTPARPTSPKPSPHSGQ
ncbi:zinc transporter ZitB [Demequina sediminis]|uniref:Zinc transporter ZitB n=1 Tax=Demequina sediminis TaxID=1930058 RepID=A0ABP9WIZ3_9MICO|nr:cation transporter [Demequina sediminis]BDZ60231.1 transporter [Demequina sediminis]BDZ63009.1 transporter [Demequina sediminis]